MKRKSFRRILALVLLCSMLTGQMMVSEALAANEIPIFGDEEIIVTPGDDFVPELPEETEEPELPEIPVVPDDPEIPEQPGEGPAGTDELAPLEPDQFEDLILVDSIKDEAALANGDGGLTVDVTSSQTEVKDGDKFTFTILIQDTNLNVKPNIEQGNELKIQIPDFLDPGDLKEAFKNCFGVFDENVGYDAATRTITLKYKGGAVDDKGTINLALNVTMLVRAIDHKPGESTTIKVGLGDTEEGIGGDLDIDIDDGTGSGDDGGSEEPEPYLRKRIWGNGGNGGSSIIQDIKDPIGYTVEFGVNSNYTGKVTLSDDLSNGSLMLCDADGKPENGFKSIILVVGEKTFTGDTAPLEFSNTALGKITIDRATPGFTVVCEKDPNADGAEIDEGIVPVVVRYYAKAANDTAEVFTNTVELTIDEQTPLKDSETILKYDTQMLNIEKSILVDNEGYPVVDIDDNQGTVAVTFRLTLTQLNIGNIFKNGAEVTVDELADCFSYNNRFEVSPENAPFEIKVDEQDSQKLKVVKIGNEDIRPGTYYIDFTVNVKLGEDGLDYGKFAINDVGTPVFVRRKAKLEIDKTWTGEETNEKGNGAKFGLYNGDTLIAESEWSDEESFVLRFNADRLAEGRHTYSLRETVDENSDYIAAKDMDVVITKSGNEVVINSIIKLIGGTKVETEYNKGTASVTVTNEPDTKEGSLKFQKYGGSGSDRKLIPGGKFNLYIVEAGGDRLIREFTTTDGEIVFEPLPYGTYYVKEVSAPPGYVLKAEESGHVEIKKTDPHPSLYMENELYDDGSIRVEKKDEKGDPMPGVSFTLTSADNQSITKTTDENGVVSFDGLTAGTYSIKETMPVGYTGYEGALSVVIDTSNKSVSLTVPGDIGQGVSIEGSTITFSWVNTQLFGSISLTKTNKDYAALAGAEFELYAADGVTLVNRGTTGEDGKLKFENLAYGDYILKETKAPEGYVISDDLSQGVKVTISSVEHELYLRFINDTRKGSISITKTDSGTTAPLAGATFGLYRDENARDQIEQRPTGADGIVSFGGLEAGTYYVKEITAPTGYQLNTEIFKFEIGPQSEDESKIVWEHNETITNAKRLYGLKIVKEDDNSQALAGAEFTLTGAGIEPQTAITDKDGFAYFTKLPFGTYNITETKAPSGYVPVTKIEPVTIGGNMPSDYEPGQVLTVGPITNDHTRLTVFKVDDKNTTKGLPGTKFKIMSGEQYVQAEHINGVYVFTDFTASAEEATEFETGEGGTFVLDYLPIGDYVLVETEAPEGYIISEKPRDFDISSASQSVTVGNTQIKAELSIVKTDEFGKLLPGVGFTLRTAQGYVQASGDNGSYTCTGLGEEATVLLTGADGRLSVKDLLWGVYTLEEVITPEGLDPVKLDDPITVDAGKHNTTISLPLVNNRKLGDLEFKKTDSKGDGLSGAVFKLEFVSGSEYSAKEPMYAVSGDDGIVRFNNVPYGVYKLTEYLAPYGKELSKDIYYVSVGGAVDDNKLQELPFDWVNNDREIEVTFKKLSTDGRALAGAVFRVLAEDGETVVVDDFTVNSAEGESRELPLGVYWLEEVSAPANYVMEETPVRFEVTLNGPNVVVMKNAPYTGSLTIVKADEAEGEKLLPGAEFKVYRRGDYIKNGSGAKVLYTATTNADGKVVINDIPFGNYAVVETRAPYGYELSGEPQYFSIKNANGVELGSSELRFENEKSRYLIGISKVDIDDHGQLLGGAAFAVSGTNFYTEVTTGADGHVTVEVPAPGEYNITEIQAPAGYTIDPNVYKVTVTGHSSEEEIPLEAQFTSKDHKTRISLLKVDENGETLDGAYFAVLNLDGEPMRFSFDGSAYVFVADGEITEIPVGSAVIKGLPVGGYILHETVVPEEYMSLGDIAFTVDAGRYDKALELTAENIPHSNGVAICKENADGIRLAGAEFTLYDGAGAKLETVVTKASGYAVFSGLGSGSYTIKETAAPVGYKLIDTGYSFEIDGSGVLSIGFDFVSVNGADTFYVLTVINEAAEQSFRVKKLSAESGKALEGAQFRIVGAGVDKLFTSGPDGLTGEIVLPVGEYMLTEIKAPGGYIADASGHHVLVTADGVEIDGEPVNSEAEFTVLNAPASFELAIMKKDETSGKPLAGAAFTITGTDGSRYSLISGEGGMTERISLKPGTYAVTEAVAPEGYELPLAGWSFTVDEGSLQVSKVSGGADHSFENGILTLTLTNKRTVGSLLINKHDSANKDLPLSGAKFRLFDKQGERLWFTFADGAYTVAAPGTPGAIVNLKTNSRGEIRVNGLEFGSYTLREVAAPEGYKLSSDDIIIKLTEQDEIISVDVPNEKLLKKVTVIKQSAGEDPVNLIGAVFALYSVAEDDETGDFISEATTLYDGRAEFVVPYTPNGKYLIVETRAPEGYELSKDKPWKFSFDEITEGEEFTYTFTNEKSSYGLEIYKHDSENIKKALAGAEFAVTDSRGFTKVITTGDDGIARLDGLVYDDYTIREISAPEGYYLNEQVFSVSRDDLTHGAAVRIEVEDERILGSVSLKKIDHETKALLEGAEFTVADKDGKLLGWNKTDDGYVFSAEGETTVFAAGEVKLSGIPAGEYSISEIKAPDGYLILDEKRPFTISAENARLGIELEIENIRRETAVGVIKIDSKNHAKRLEGAEFTLYTLVDGKPGEAIAVKTTDKNGLVVFTGLTMGEYRIVETKAPEGYALQKYNLDVRIDGEGNVFAGDEDLHEIQQVYMAAIVNHANTQKLTLKKVSAESGKPLPGACFTISGNDKTWRVTTDKNGIAAISLAYGEYIIEELVAPNGYVLDNSPHTLSVSKDGIKYDGKILAELTCVIKNEPVEYPVSFHKQDSSDGAALAGAKFTISGNGKTFDLVTNASGDTTTIYLKPGEYSVSEIVAPNGYKRPMSGWTLTVTESGKAYISGRGATVAVNSGSITVTLENDREPGGSYIAKTGQTKDNSMLMGGAALMLGSFMGLMSMLVSELKRRRKAADNKN